MRSFINTLPGVFDAIETSDEVRTAFIFAAWRTVAGEQVVERTGLLAVEDRRLIIAVADKTWKRNLETLASQLLFKLNASLGKPLVDYIEFRIEPTAVERTDAHRTAPGFERSDPPVELSVSARKIQDEGLRKTFLGAAMNCLERQK